MTAAQVRARLGAPQNVLPSGRLRCLVYPAHKPSTDVAYVVFCVNGANRVARIYSGAAPVPPA